jgi:hypothetical protein
MPKVSNFPYQAPTPATKIPVVGETHFLVGDIAPAKVYRAIIYEFMTNVTVYVLENSLGGTVAWSYNAPGSYKGVLVGAFPPLKCHTMVQQRSAFTGQSTIGIKAPNNDSDDIWLETTSDGTNAADGQMPEGVCIQVLVYP